MAQDVVWFGCLCQTNQGTAMLRCSPRVPTKL
jgi:hypothetical protein